MREPIAAVVFDLDGVRGDAEPAHRVTSRRLVAPQVLTDAEYALFIGTSVAAFAAWLRERYALSETPEAIAARYDTLVSAELEAQRLPALDGAHELLATLRARGVALAVASQSLPRWVELTLAGAGLAGAFDRVVAGDAVARAKPAPDTYRHAAALLGVPANRCLALEDSIPGWRRRSRPVWQSSSRGRRSPPSPRSRAWSRRSARCVRSILAGWKARRSGTVSAARVARPRRRC